MNFSIHCFNYYFLLLGKYCDIPLGLFIVRGDNIVLLGEENNESTLKLIKITPEEFAQSKEADQLGKVDWDLDG